MTAPARHRLPNRRKAVTQEVIAGAMTVTASIGFAEDGRPAELFLAAGKPGSMLDALLGDAAVAISIALQHGIQASALRKSVARIPETIDGPATAAASPLGAALDLLASYEGETP
jgi:hypothetical protein